MIKNVLHLATKHGFLFNSESVDLLQAGSLDCCTSLKKIPRDRIINDEVCAVEDRLAILANSNRRI